MSTHAARPHVPTRPSGSQDRRVSDHADRYERRNVPVAAIEQEVGAAAAERHSAVRDGGYRRALSVADVFAAALALTLSVQVFGDDRLRGLTLICLPIVVVVSK